MSMLKQIEINYDGAPANVIGYSIRLGRIFALNFPGVRSNI